MSKKYLKQFVVVILLLAGHVSCKTSSVKEPINKEHSFKSSVEEKVNMKYELFDDFQNGIVTERVWKRTRQNDFKESIIDVSEVGEGDLRLRMRANTIGTKDETVKFHGIRSIRRVDFAEGNTIMFDMDWNNQTNGCYLSAGLYLCPTNTGTNPGDEPSWIAFKYVGVPPGRNARFEVSNNHNGVFKYIFTEGWPEKQRVGRKIKNQHVEIIIDNKSLKIVENGKEIFTSDDHGLSFTQAYLYLQMSSHNNYPAREIYFDNIVVSRK